MRRRDGCNLGGPTRHFETVTILAIALVAAAVIAFGALPPLHPAQLWAVVWALAVGSYALKLLPYSPLGGEVQVLIGGASLCFIGGTLVGEHLGARVGSILPLSCSELRARDLPVAATIAVGVTFLGLTAFLAQATQKYGLHAALVSSPQVRLAIQAGVFKVTIKYVYAAVAAALLCGACAATDRHRLRWIVLAALAIVSTYFTTGRSSLVVGTISALCAYALVAAKLPQRRSLIVGAVAVAAVAFTIFTIGGSVIGKTFKNSELATIDSSFVQHPAFRWAALPYEYLSAPIAAFGVEVSLARHIPRTDGCASAAVLCTILTDVGVNAKPFPQVRPFTAPPVKWNTYTSLDAPLLDGGTGLVVPAAAFVGAIMGALWLAARRRRWLAIVLYATLAPAIATAFGSNGFTAPLQLGVALITVGSVLVARVVNIRRAEPA